MPAAPTCSDEDQLQLIAEGRERGRRLTLVAAAAEEATEEARDDTLLALQRMTSVSRWQDLRWSATHKDLASATTLDDRLANAQLALARRLEMALLAEADALTAVTDAPETREKTEEAETLSEEMREETDLEASLKALLAAEAIEVAAEAEEAAGELIQEVIVAVKNVSRARRCPRPRLTHLRRRKSAGPTWSPELHPTPV